MVHINKFTKVKSGKNLKPHLIYCVLFVFLVSIISFPKEISNGIKSGLGCCLNTLIPAMFPFMIISSMLLTVGKNHNSESFLSKIFESVFFLPSYVFPVVILSLFGGYPVGAYCTKHLYKNKKINSEQLNRIMTFCVNSGPAFIISVLGETLLKSGEIGIKLFLVQVLSSIMIGLFSGILARIKKLSLHKNSNITKNSNLTFSDILIDSCHNTCKSLINMCSLITLFFAINSVINQLNLIYYISFMLGKIGIPPYFASVFISSLSEMTQGCLIAAKNIYCPYWIYSWIVGFGGICAHTQIIAELKNSPFKYKKFLMARILNGIFTAIITYFAIRNNIPAEAYSNLYQSFKISKSVPTNFGSATLLFFCVLFTLNSHLPVRKNSKSIIKNSSTTNTG